MLLILLPFILELLLKFSLHSFLDFLLLLLLILLLLLFPLLLDFFLKFLLVVKFLFFFLLLLIFELVSLLFDLVLPLSLLKYLSAQVLLSLSQLPSSLSSRILSIIKHLFLLSSIQLHISLLLKSHFCLHLQFLLLGQLLIQLSGFFFPDFNIGIVVRLKLLLRLEELILIFLKLSPGRLELLRHLLFFGGKLIMLLVDLLSFFHCPSFGSNLSLRQSHKLIIIQVFSTGILVVGNDGQLI